MLYVKSLGGWNSFVAFYFFWVTVFKNVVLELFSGGDCFSDDLYGFLVGSFSWSQNIDFRIYSMLAFYRYFNISELENLISGYYIYSYEIVNNVFSSATFSWNEHTGQSLLSMQLPRKQSFKKTRK